MSIEKWRSPIFEKKAQIIDLFVPKLTVFGQFLEIASLDFADFAYYDKKEWYLAEPSGSSFQKMTLFRILT